MRGAGADDLSEPKNRVRDLVRPRSAGSRRLSLVGIAAAAMLMTAASEAGARTATAAHTARASVTRAGSATVWLCRPGMAADPCAGSLSATTVSASGTTRVNDGRPAANPRFDCFYVYPTVSGEPQMNADLRVQTAETSVAVAQASRFSQTCRVYAPMYQQVTLAGLQRYPTLAVPTRYGTIAYASLVAGFKDYLAHYNDGRPIVFIGHSQGAVMLIELLAQMVDNNVSLRNRLVLAVILGGDVEVRAGALTGGSFTHLPLCSQSGEDGCVIAYSSFPGKPPASSLFGRPGQPLALDSGQQGRNGLEVACVNPAALGGGAAVLDPYFPSEGALPTPWVEFPGLYSARCETEGGFTWLQVTKETGSSDKRPVVTENAGPDWGYHTADVNLALGNLVTDVFAAEKTWSARHKSA
jgi:Protein of unknown function (DUF3089)